ncbi:SCO3242 family prenyltransferase [Catenuloplanes japonicus]|uniref:SCO3242 family prenyltransferase n=1 Tax=Catenuloplanes japonicus TaxID=33876 RepID=UPI000526DE57|nr:UbiA family prenyltransferase [Catenuloplanes japonicus]
MGRLADLIQLVRAPAALSVPGDLVAGASAAGTLGPATAGLAAASVCLYWAGMAANDWSDRDLDAVERPERPIPSGRISPGAALGIAAGLTAAGVSVAAAVGGRRALTVAVPLAATIWTYDLRAKNTAAGPAMMAACRALDVLLGATSPGPRTLGRALWRALPTAAAIGAHTYTVTELSRKEVSGARPALPATTLAATGALTAAIATAPPSRAAAAPSRAAVPGFRNAIAMGSARRFAPGTGSASGADAATGSAPCAGTETASARRRPIAVGPVSRAATGVGAIPRAAVVGALAGQYLTSYGAAQARAIASPTPGTVRAAVGAGITAFPALQGALAARAGSPLAGLAVAAVAPLARLLARRVSPT